MAAKAKQVLLRINGTYMRDWIIYELRQQFGPGGVREHESLFPDKGWVPWFTHPDWSIKIVGDVMIVQTTKPRVIIRAGLEINMRGAGRLEIEGLADPNDR